jgi:hypothetical protein
MRWLVEDSRVRVVVVVIVIGSISKADIVVEDVLLPRG